MVRQALAQIKPRVLPVIVGLSALIFGPMSARADFFMSIGNIQRTSATAGTFEVDLTNTDSKIYNVAGFNFELMLPASSGIQFTGASTSTPAHPYIFSGTGSATVDPSFLLSYDPFPNTSFTASDTEFTFPSIAVTSGSTFGLGLVTFAINPSVATGAIPINFVSLGTGLSDAAGNAIPFTTHGGSIQFASVPEPSSLVLLTIATGILVSVRKYGNTRSCPASRSGL